MTQLDYSILNNPDYKDKIVKLGAVRKKYQELDLFRKEIDQAKAGVHHQPYTYYKKIVLMYRTAFLGFSLLFLILGTICFNIHIIHLWGLFESTSVVKGFFVALCSLLSLGGISLALGMKTEKEAVHAITKTSKASIAKIYSRRRAKFGIKWYLAFLGPHKEEVEAIRHTYEEVLEKIIVKREEALHLLHNIGTAETLDLTEKEDLMNQALIELKEQLTGNVNNFRNV